MDYGYLVEKARQGSLGTDDQNYQALMRQANAGVQDAVNLLAEIRAAGGANPRIGTNRAV